ncbi:DUF1801 domain-containing protein [Subsaxibacter sp. CAU 1640]|uniref:iron chaperone n=1 Tax=Subsaxibacter sp. CAU 1640 TaxID=2933271 RepID=UPI002003F0B6|nr:DUF1801 domain-containing protein [Subsaxibacter sp. CAU 1640]MCK7591120.1 DUF1801 domain-containing protein [Subsaxibacter sp. CAU 1640]
MIGAFLFLIVVMKEIEDYIKQFPESTQEKLRQIYHEIKIVAVDAEELISYGMPAFKLNKKPLVYFAGYKNHIGFYATPTGHEAFIKELSRYKQGKGSVQFPLDKPLPLDLIRKIVEFRIKENNIKK